MGPWKATVCGLIFRGTQSYDIRVETFSPTVNLQVWERAWG